MSLERYYIAQQQDYAKALEELQNGKKQSHWMWYIFPQLKGMGHSPTSRYYAIQSFTEANEYLNDPVLGPRLLRLSEVLLNAETADPVQIFGSTDAVKLRSCMTLFSLVAEHPDVFNAVLDRFFDGTRCPFTMNAYTLEVEQHTDSSV